MSLKNLSKNSKYIVGVISLFFLANALTNAFVYLYLWRLNNDLAFVARFDLQMYASLLVGFIISNVLVKYISYKNLLKIGGLIIVGAYSTLLGLGDNIVSLLPVYTLTLGFGTGMFWAFASFYTIQATRKENRNVFFSAVTGLSAFVSIATPLLTGFIITKLPQVFGSNMSGYYLTYLLAILVIAAMVYLGTKVSEEFPENLHLKSIIGVFKNRGFYNIGALSFFTGFYETATRMVLVISAIKFLESELMVGEFTSLIGLVGVVYILILGEKIKNTNNILVTLFGSLITSTATVVLALNFSLTGLAVWGLLLAIGAPMVSIPRNSAIITCMENLANKHSQSELLYLTSREFLLDMGRICGSAVLFLYIITTNSKAVDIVTPWLTILSVIPLASWYFLKKELELQNKSL